MRIAIVASSAGGGGAERVAVNIANWLVKKGETVLYIAAVKDNIEYVLSQQVDYVFVKQVRPRSAFRSIQIAAVAKKWQADVVLSFLLKEMAFAELIKIPVVVSLRFNPLSPVGLKRSKEINHAFTHARAIVFQTKMARELYPEYIDKSYVIGNPVSSSIPDWDIKKSNNRFIAIGRLEKVKNYEMMIRAFSKFASYHEGYELDIYGDGSQKEELVHLIESCRMSDRIHLLGNSSDIYEIMSLAYGFIQTSDSEGLSNSMLEALCIGVPVICTDCQIGGPREYIENDVNGVLIAVGDEVPLVNALEKMISSDEFRHGVSVNAKKLKNKLIGDGIYEKWYKCLTESAGKYDARDKNFNSF